MRGKQCSTTHGVMNEEPEGRSEQLLLSLELVVSLPSEHVHVKNNKVKK